MSSRWLENMAIKKSRDLKMIISRKSSIYFYWITISFFIASPFAFLSCRNANVNPPISHSSGIIPTPIPDYLFHDDFSDSSSGWDQINVQEGIADYENGQYSSQKTAETELISLNKGQSATFTHSLELDQSYDTALIIVDIGSQNIYYTVEVEQ